MKNKLLFTAAMLLLVLSACTKKKNPSPGGKTEDPIPQIVINQPSGDHYEAGDTVGINVVVTDSKEMHEALYWIIAKPQQDTLWKEKKHVHGAKTIVLDTYFVPPVLQSHQQLELVVQAENSEGKTAEARHLFEIH